MTFIIKIFGAVAICVFALRLLRGYKRYLEKRKAECEGFILVIEAVRDGVDYFLSPLKRIFERFCEGDSPLARISKRICGGESPKTAFESEKDGLHIGESGKDILSGFFSSLGRGYKDGAVSMSEACKKKFEKYSAEREREDEKNARLATTLVVGGALAVIILFI